MQTLPIKVEKLLSDWRVRADKMCVGEDYEFGIMLRQYANELEQCFSPTVTITAGPIDPNVTD
jgi:hypothetical protein